MLFNHFRRSLLTVMATAVSAALLPSTASANCANLTAKGDINIIGNSFPALQHIAKEMESCNKPGLKVSFKMTSPAQARTETEQETPAGLGWSTA